VWGERGGRAELAYNNLRQCAGHGKKRRAKTSVDGKDGDGAQRVAVVMKNKVADKRESEGRGSCKRKK